jgi:hypothetical protein
MVLMLPPHLLDPSLPVPRDDPPQAPAASAAPVRPRVCGLRDWRPRLAPSAVTNRVAENQRRNVR